MTAVQNASVHLVHELFSTDADLNAVDRYGWSPLHSGAEQYDEPKHLAGVARPRHAYFVLYGVKLRLRHIANMSEGETNTVCEISSVIRCRKLWPLSHGKKVVSGRRRVLKETVGCQLKDVRAISDLKAIPIPASARPQVVAAAVHSKAFGAARQGGSVILQTGS
ncbi:MAG: hypothetical protein AAGF72_09510 [Pseudomonadota bacterium]